MKKSLLIYYMLLMALLPATVWGQERSSNMQITGRVTFLNAMGEEVLGPGVLDYAVMNSTVAAKAWKEFDVLFKSNQPDMYEKAIQMMKDYEINSKTNHNSSYSFKRNVTSSMSLLFVDYVDGEVKLVNITPGRTVYDDIVINLKNIKEVVVKDTLRSKPVTKCTNKKPGNGYMYFETKLELPKGYTRTDTRLLLQMVAVDCETDDTLDYVYSLAAEGKRFHEQQIKRMGYNYEKNDPVSKFYRKDIVLHQDSAFSFSNTVKWKIPDNLSNHNFRGSYTYTLEDCNVHPYYRESTEPSCMQEAPFKLLDLTPALSELPLEREFYEKPEPNYEEKDDKLDLLFEVNSDKLKSTPENERERDRLINLIRSFGKKLMSFTLVGSASPDGTLENNKTVAKKRAEAARNMIMKSGKVSVPLNVSVKTYQWSDVVTELRQQGKTAQADLVWQLVQEGGPEATVGKRIAALPFYAADVEPILESQRAMKCRYSLSMETIMTREECAAQYFKRKKDYLSRRIRFSNGDFYHLFETLTDSLELDTLTALAYQEITDMRGYATENVMSPYVCNRMAMRMMRRGQPNVNILRPFIDFSRRSNKAEHANRGIDAEMHTLSRGMIPVNRRQMVANQAICYFMEQKVDTALYLLQWLKDCGKADQKVMQMVDIIKLSELHCKNDKTPAEIEQYNKALQTVLDMSDYNKAVLYTEVGELGHRGQAAFWVDKISDDHPAKWYLKGLLAAIFHHSLPDLPMTYLNTMPELLDVPQYLAYFQHCFDLDKTHRYFRYYKNESHVSMELRKKYKYSKAKTDNYRQLFDVLNSLYGRERSEGQ